MKKIISLLLAVVTVCSLLTGICFADEPVGIHPELATLKVYAESDPSKAYYFEELDQTAIDWACLNLPGRKIFELLQDYEIYTVSESNILSVPTSSSRWYNKDIKAAKTATIVLELGGHTLSFYGGGNMFYFERFGMDIKNGTILYHNTAGKTRVPFCFGSTSGGTANSKADTCYDPVLNLDNVHIYSDAGSVVKSYLYDTQVNVTNSVLWSAAETNTVIFYQTKQNVSNKWTGPYQPSLTVKNSIIGSNAYYYVSSSYEGSKASVEDSIVVSGSTDRPMATSSKVKAAYSAEPAKLKDWSFGLRDGSTVKGHAYVVGNAPEFMPFSDVKEGDWFYDFVKELYEKKVVAGQTATTFNPSGNLTYGAALKLLVVGLTGKDEGNAASGHWAEGYLNTAKAGGWTDIDAAKLNDPITREAFCEIAAKAKNLTKQPAANKFTDTQNTAVLALVEAGVINGMSDTTFQPAGILTRAQISKIISLLLKL